MTTRRRTAVVMASPHGPSHLPETRADSGQWKCAVDKITSVPLFLVQLLWILDWIISPHTHTSLMIPRAPGKSAVERLSGRSPEDAAEVTLPTSVCLPCRTHKAKNAFCIGTTVPRYQRVKPGTSRYADCWDNGRQRTKYIFTRFGWWQFRRLTPRCLRDRR